MSSGLSYNAGPETRTADLIEKKIRAENIVKAGSSWFLWVAGLSMINSVLAISGVNFRFIFGLGMAQVVDAFAHHAGSAGAVLDLFINGCVAAIFVVFWNFARQGQKWAFFVGIAFYALDGLLMLLFKDILGLAFHAYVIFRIYGSLSAMDDLERLRQLTSHENVAIEPR